MTRRFDASSSKHDEQFVFTVIGHGVTWSNHILMSIYRHNQMNKSQKLFNPKQQSSWLGQKDHRAFESKGAMQAAVGYHLESNYKSCPSAHVGRFMDIEKSCHRGIGYHKS